jgi:hypothetical protein
MFPIDIHETSAATTPQPQSAKRRTQNQCHRNISLGNVLHHKSLGHRRVVHLAPEAKASATRNYGQPNAHHRCLSHNAVGLGGYRVHQQFHYKVFNRSDEHTLNNSDGGILHTASKT